MFPRSKRSETVINVMLDEPLTNESCTKVVIELLKYILYQKQQIPFAYEALAQFQTSIKATDRNAVSFRALSNTLKNISENLSSHFFLEGCDIKEIAVLIGATILSPKLYIVIELPSYILNSAEHKEYQHSSRKPLLKLMRFILGCYEFQEALSIPVNLTNTFIMLRKSDNNAVSEFFLPKPQYVPPVQVTNCFRIKLCQSDQVDLQCNCKNLVKVYHDTFKTHLTDQEDIKHSQYNSTNEALYRWHQSKQIIKGFKFYS